MEAKIIFDSATKPFPWSQIWVAAGAFAFGCILIALGKFRSLDKMAGKSGYFMIVCAIVGAGYVPTRWHLSHHSWALASGRYEVVQGPVEAFHLMPHDGSSGESFSIKGRTFSYSDYDESGTTACFNQTNSHGSPIREGLVLRVVFIDQCILKIEELQYGDTHFRLAR